MLGSSIPDSCRISYVSQVLLIMKNWIVAQKYHWMKTDLI